MTVGEAIPIVIGALQYSEHKSFTFLLISNSFFIA